MAKSRALTRDKIQAAQRRAAAMLDNAGIVLTAHERASIEVADLGLGELDRQGLQIVTYINTDRYCAKELIMFPRQTCCEHRHPEVANRAGKMETFRCRWGEVYLYIPGQPTPDARAITPVGSEQYYTVRHEIVLKPGQQYTIEDDTLHWFQAGDQGAVVSEFSSTSRDESDIFTDPRIRRVADVQ